MTTPHTVYLMPQNASNQPIPPGLIRFDETKHIPFDKVLDLLDDFDAMGVEHVEVTGGGEPLAYPDTQKLWEQFMFHDFTTSLVTNGTLLRGRAGMIVRAGAKRVRVDIDAPTAATYGKLRHVPEYHFDRAWQAVREFCEQAKDNPEFLVEVVPTAQLPTGCIIEGSGNVYNNLKFIGNFISHARGFRGVWEGVD